MFLYVDGMCPGSSNSSGTDKWIEVSYTQWAESKKDRLTQLGGMLKKYGTDSPDIRSWLERRIAGIEGSFSEEL